MGFFSFLDSAAAEAFGRELALFVLAELMPGMQVKGSKPKGKSQKALVKAEKGLIKADRKVQQFRASHKLNFYKRSKLANAFLWELKDANCPPEYATQLTEWLTPRL